MHDSTSNPALSADRIRPLADPYAVPNGYTRVNNHVFDHILPTLSGNGLKVLLIALRQTWGWHDPRSPTGRKLSDEISYSQFMRQGGMARATVARAIQECLDAGYLLRRKKGRGHVYALSAAFAPTGSELEPPTGSESEHTKEKDGNIGGEDAARILSLLQDFEMNLDREVRALAARYTLPQIEHAISRARQHGKRNPQGLLRHWMRTGHMPLPSPKEQKHATASRRPPQLNQDARAFAAYRAAQQAACVRSAGGSGV